MILSSNKACEPIKFVSSCIYEGVIETGVNISPAFVSLYQLKELRRLKSQIMTVIHIIGLI